MVEHTQTHSPAFFSLWIYLSDNFQRKVPKEISRRKVGFSFLSNESLHVSLPGLKTQEQNSAFKPFKTTNDDNISINW